MDRKDRPMTISELISTLEGFKAEYGDIDVVTGSEYSHAPSPSVEPDDGEYYYADDDDIPNVVFL